MGQTVRPAEHKQTNRDTDRHTLPKIFPPLMWELPVIIGIKQINLVMTSCHPCQDSHPTDNLLYVFKQKR